MQIFSGSSNIALAKKVSKKGQFELGAVELSTFSNKELRVWVQQKNVGTRAYVLQSLSAPTEKHLVEFTLISDALRRLGVKNIVAIIPWLGYSKQDKVFRSGEPLSVKVIANLLQTVPLEKIYTFDLHNPAIIGFFDIPLISLTATSLFASHFQQMEKKHLLVVAPDAGAVKPATQFAQELGVGVVYIDKKREITTGKVSIKGISSSIRNKSIIMIDDMISTGSTLLETSKYLKKHGAKSIHVAATHHLYVPKTQEKLDASDIDELIVTDTVQKPKDTVGKKLNIVSVAPLICEAVQ